MSRPTIPAPERAGITDPTTVGRFIMGDCDFAIELWPGELYHNGGRYPVIIDHIENVIRLSDGVPDPAKAIGGAVQSLLRGAMRREVERGADGRLQCPHCQRTYKGERVLARHLRCEHNDDYTADALLGNTDGDFDL